MQGLTIAMRELRGGFADFRVLLACLILGVAAIAAVGSVRMAVQEGLVREGATILGGDAEMEFTYRFASEAERNWMAGKAEAVSEIVEFRSMAVVTRDGVTERALAQIKGVDAAYPLYGEVRLDPPMPLSEALAGNGFAAERVLVDRLGLEIGESVTFGLAEFELRAVLEREPDTAANGFTFGPRVLLRKDALDASGLIQPGTLFDTHYRLRFAEPGGLAKLKEEANGLFRDAGMRWRDRRNGSPGTARFVERMGSFLVLVGLAGLAVGGIGVAASVRAYLETKTNTIATLKTIGASGGVIFTAYFAVIGAMAAAGVFFGVLLGAGLPVLLGPILSAALPVPAVFDFYLRPAAEATLYGLLTAAIFTLWPLARTRDIRAAGLFRDVVDQGSLLPRWPYLVAVLLLAAALIGFAALFSGMVLLALWSAFGVIAALAVLLLAAQVARWVANRIAHSRLARGRPALRLACAAVAGPGSDAYAVVLSLGLGLTVLATIGQIDANLRQSISGALPQIAPAYFVVDIQSGDRDGFVEVAGAGGSVRTETAPMLRGIVTRINGAPAREVAGSHWVLRGERGVTYSDDPGDAEITEGAWWEPGYDGPPLVSFAEEEGRELGLKIGDRITVNLLGRDVEAEIANFRVVDFSDMGINFLIVLNESALRGAPHSHIATLYADEADEGRLLRTISEAYPTVTAIRTRDAIARAADTVGTIATAIRWSAAATLLTGFVVLIGAAAAGERRRVFEAAVLKTVGAVRRRILASFAIRAAILGSAAGLVAVLAAGLAAWSVMTFVMEAEYRFEPVSALLIILGGTLANLLAGLAFSVRPLAARPARILRSRD